MKFFMPTYAVALTLAVTSSMFEQASATACVQADVCPTIGDCATVADGTAAPGAVVKPNTLKCSKGKFAYIKTLKIYATGAALPATYGLFYKKDGTAVTTVAGGTAATALAASAGCENTYTNVGADATADVTAVVGCTGTTTGCALKYKADWDCQTPDVCLASDSSITATSIAVGGNFPLTKPETLKCADTKFAFISSLDVGTTSATNAAVVTFTNGASANLAATKDTSTCDGQWTDVGRTTATANVQGKIACTDATAVCAAKVKVSWACQVDSCAKTCTDAKCTATNVVQATPFTLARPAVADLPACGDGKFAYLSSFEVGADKTTTYDQFTVAFTSGAAGTALAATKDSTVCDTRWTDVGKSATGDVGVKVTCTAASCDIKYKAVWACQGATPAPAPAPKSGVAGVCPVAAWGTALVAAVAGANYAAPL